RPLLYYLFGHLHDPESLVLAEDDYFKMLIQASRASRGPTLAGGMRFQPIQDPQVSHPIPQDVLRALTDCSLVFLGFRLPQWDFRVLVQYINALQGSPLLEAHTQVAVQVDPGQGHFLDPDSARQYLERNTRFGEATLSIYWGKAEEFLKELDHNFTEELRKQV